MATRTKRKAATKSAVIELSSDSDAEETRIPYKKKNKQTDSDYGELPDKKKSKKLPVKSLKRIKSTSQIQLKSTSTKSINAANNGLEHIKTDESDGNNLGRLKKFKKLCKAWQDYELLSELECIDQNSAKNIIKLFEDENTIPFICRYRRDMIREDINPEKLRDIKNTYIEIVALKKRVDNIIKQLEKEEILTNEIENQLLCAKSIDELEYVYAPYKPASKGSLADRAKALGLEKYCNYILDGRDPPIMFADIVDPTNSEIDTIERVSEGISHIMSHIFTKSTEVLEELRRLEKIHRIVLKCKKAKNTKEQKDNKNAISKYENYFEYENCVRYLKPHQVLAINRGEKAKELSVKIIVPEKFKNEIKYFIRNHFLSKGCHYPLRLQLFEKSFEECYSKKLQPLVSRKIRSELNEKATKASIEVFAKNLKQLLLMSPVKGEKILGIDPGFSNGCKLALISETTDVIETAVIYPHKKFGNIQECTEKIVGLLKRHGCKLIALGNGTACRETECWLSQLFEDRILDKQIVKYCIVSEQGASIYSCGEIAKKEFPDMDVNLISAVSIARRLNDPLCEYVKIEPRHIGVGMYQHDVNEKVLNETLNEVVIECASFVGVDINTASISLLKHISGLTVSKAEKIINYRIKNGPFETRKDLLKVKTIGEKTFTQCAGFIRIDNAKINALDSTWVHPESYNIAEKIISECKLNLKDIGQHKFIQTIKQYNISSSFENLETKFKIPKERIKIILEALQRELFRDYRFDFNKKPLFKEGLQKMSDLQKGLNVTGAVTNITHFGAFVDIGVEHDGLIHSTNMNGMILNIGDRIETVILDVDIRRKRIQLKLEEIINF